MTGNQEIDSERLRLGEVIAVSERGPEMRILKAVGVVVMLFLSILALNVAYSDIDSQSDTRVLTGIAIAVVLGAVWVGIAAKIICSVRSRMKALVFACLGFTLLTSTGCVGCARINPGNVGIKVNLYGKGRGVENYPLVTGMVWYNPITTQILEYPTYVQTAVWTASALEGSALNEEISFNTKEGIIVNADISLSYQLDAQKAPSFYVKFRSDDLKTFTHGFLRNVARDSFNEMGARYAVDEVYGIKKEELLVAVRERINNQVTAFGIELQQFGFIGAPRLPQNVVDAINAKIKATQDALRVENELRQSTAEAQKRIAAAMGEAEANRLLTGSLSPTLLEWKRLEISQQATAKWNGQLPYYNGGGAMPFIQVPSPPQSGR